MKKLEFDKLVETLKDLTGKRVLITFHSVADTDCVSSAFGLKLLLKNAELATPDIVTANSRRILSTFGFDPETVSVKFDNDAEAVVLVDVNNFDDCGQFAQRLKDFKGTVLIIDHHINFDINSDNVLAYNRESYNSATSIVYEVLKNTGITIDANMAKLLAAGIISDSAELQNASGQTLLQLGTLLTIANMDYPSITASITHVSDPEARKRTINDLQEATVEVVQGLLFMHGMAHAHANLAADHAIKIGADLALFSAENEREVSFSARLRPLLDKERNLHLGAIMKRLGPIINGSGGGHPCAAGAYGPLKERARDFIDMFITEITSNISVK
jgi:nanoRNase/pAp phosphatase (c-di-AMP/oligoRNAs hydrolase)